MAKTSKRKARKLRKQGKLAPSIKVGHGHVVYKGFGIHEDKRRKALKKIAKQELSY